MCGPTSPDFMTPSAESKIPPGAGKCHPTQAAITRPPYPRRSPSSSWVAEDAHEQRSSGMKKNVDVAPMAEAKRFGVSGKKGAPANLQLQENQTSPLMLPLGDARILG